MKLVRIRIEKLFGQFNYNIALNQEEGITILTGPNGYGKTTILNIIYDLFTGSSSYTPYAKATLFFSDGCQLESPQDRDAIKDMIPAYLIEGRKSLAYSDVAESGEIVILNRIDLLSKNLVDRMSGAEKNDCFLAKLEVFSSIIDGKCFPNKTLAIDSAQGLRFTTFDGEPLALAALSAGEQREIILLYELLFNAQPDSLVLIDDPEISMHVAWLIEYFKDIERIAKLSGLSFIVATHSPDIINDKGDLCVDLFSGAWDDENTYE